MKATLCQATLLLFFGLVSGAIAQSQPLELPESESPSWNQDDPDWGGFCVSDLGAHRLG